MFGELPGSFEAAVAIVVVLVVLVHLEELLSGGGVWVAGGGEVNVVDCDEASVGIADAEAGSDCMDVVVALVVGEAEEVY